MDVEKIEDIKNLNLNWLLENYLIRRFKKNRICRYDPFDLGCVNSYLEVGSLVANERKKNKIKVDDLISFNWDIIFLSSENYVEVLAPFFGGGNYGPEDIKDYSFEDKQILDGLQGKTNTIKFEKRVVPYMNSVLYPSSYIKKSENKFANSANTLIRSYLAFNSYLSEKDCNINSKIKELQDAFKGKIK